MRIDEEPHFMALRRAYCYLRLSGHGSDAAVAQLRGYLDGPEHTPGDVLDAVLGRRSGASRPVAEAPPLQRGHVRYP